MPLPLSVIDQAGFSPAAGQVLHFQQGTLAGATFELRDSAGAAVTPPANATAVLYIKPRRGDEPLLAMTGTVNGVASFTPTSRSQFEQAGLAVGIVALRDGNGDPVSMFETFVEIHPNLIGKVTNTPLTVDYVRQLLRDRCAQDNDYTGELEFADHDIASAAFQALDWWLETVPEGSLLGSYSVMNFPGREHLALGALGQLYRAAGAAMQRNRFQAQGGGLQADDKKRAELYIQLGENLLAEFRNWATAKLVRVNLDEFCGSSYDPRFGSIEPSADYYR